MTVADIQRLLEALESIAASLEVLSHLAEEASEET